MKFIETNHQEIGESFISPEREISPENQYQFMLHFWQKVGLLPPTINQVLTAETVTKLEQNKHLRLVISPLLSLQQRELLVDVTRDVFSQTTFSTEESGLWVPGPGTVYGELLLQPNGYMKNDRGNTYRMGYRSVNGNEVVISRTKWIREMLEHGVVQQINGDLWTHVVTDVTNNGERAENVRPGELYDDIHPLDTPECALTIHLLHQTLGVPNMGLHVNFVNEAVCLVDEEDAFIQLIEVSGVRWYPEPKRVRLGHWPADYYPSGTYGVLKTV